jgi:copper homeostasis protein
MLPKLCEHLEGLALTMFPVKLEICIESVDDAVAAVAAGADRLEVNAALRLAGLTPSLGLLTEIRRLVGPQVPLVVMIRPRAGDFCYGEREFDVMLRDAELLLKNGASGIAFGVLTRDGRVDHSRCRKLVELVRSYPFATEGAVFHRAFDFVHDPLVAIDELAALGFIRIMTSGQRATACEGASEIARYIRHAAGRIEILPAAGIRPENVEALIRDTGCNQVHASLREPIPTAGGVNSDSATQAQLARDMAGGDLSQMATSPRLIRALLEKLGR